MKKRILGLDAIRGIAAVAVIFYHYFYRYNEIYGHDISILNWSYLGKHGVELFFMVSGFVIFWSLNRIDKPIEFIISRFSRLYPVYWVSVLLTFTLVSIFGLDGRSVSLVDAIINLSMLQGFIKIPPVDGVYWTLGIELIFYFLMFVLFLFKQHRNADLIFVPLVFLAILQSVNFLELNYIVNKLLIIDYISFFVSGICFYKLLNNESFNRTIFILMLCLFSTAMTYSVPHLFMFICFYLFFFLGISGRIKGLENKFFIYLGSISYALYLIHQNIGYIIINKFYDFQFSGLVGISFALIISVFLAHILTFKIEKPCLILIKKLYSSLSLKLAKN